MNSLTRTAALLGLALAFAAHAQDAQKQEAKPAEAAKPAAEAPAPEKPKPGPGQEVDPKILQDMLGCMAKGLPQDWKKAWFVVHQIGVNVDRSRKFEANFFYAKKETDKKGLRLQVCDPIKVLEGVAELNAYLPESQKLWSGMTMTFFRDGRYQANYDMSPFKPKPAPKKAPAKKKAEAAK